MTDRLEEIRAAFTVQNSYFDVLDIDDRERIAWLIAEVERLRWFEENMLPFADPNFMECNSCHVCDGSDGHKPNCEYVAHGGKR